MKKLEIQNYLQDNYSSFRNKVGIQLLNKTKSNNQNFLISSKKEKYVLHIINEKIDAKQIEKICKIIQYCNSKGAKVPKPIKNNKGKFVNEKYLGYLTKYSVGKQSLGKNLELKNLAKRLAKLHSILANCKIQYNYQMNQPNYQILTKKEIYKIKKIINKKPRKDKFDHNVLKNIHLLSEGLGKLDIFNSKIKNKPKQLIHFDLHPDNILFRNNDVTSFLDFNSIRKGIIWEDVAFCSFRFAILSKNKELLYLMNNFLKNYLEYNQSNIKFSEIVNFLQLRILKNLSYILKKQYFLNEKILLQELNKYFRFLKISNSLITN